MRSGRLLRKCSGRIEFISSLDLSCCYLPKHLRKDTDFKKKILQSYNMPILVNLDVMLAKRKRSLGELSEATGITMANLSRLKNGRSRGIRFSSLHKICEALECVPGDILERVTAEEYVKLMGHLPPGEEDDED